MPQVDSPIKALYPPETAADVGGVSAVELEVVEALHLCGVGGVGKGVGGKGDGRGDGSLSLVSGVAVVALEG